MKTNPAISALLAALVVSACQPNTATGPVVPGATASPGAAPTADSGAGPGAGPGTGTAPGQPGASPATGTPPAAAAGAYVIGKATTFDGPLGKATVALYGAAGEAGDAPLSTATSTAAGEFAFDLPSGVPAGSLLRVVATQGDRTLAGIVAAGGGNLVAAGGGNIVAAGGGNLVAAGGGNLVAAGGGNYALRAVTAGRVDLTLGTTIATLALGARLRDALGRATTDEARRQILEAADEVATRATAVLGTVDDDDLREAIAEALDARGGGTLAEALAQRLVRADAQLAQAFRTAARTLGDLIVAAGGQPSTTTFGGVTVSGRTSSGGGSSSGAGDAPTTTGTAILNVGSGFGPVVGVTSPESFEVYSTANGLDAGWLFAGGAQSDVQSATIIRVYPTAASGDFSITYSDNGSTTRIIPSRFLGVEVTTTVTDWGDSDFEITLLTPDGREVATTRVPAGTRYLSWADFGVTRSAVAGAQAVKIRCVPASTPTSEGYFQVDSLRFFISEP